MKNKQELTLEIWDNGHIVNAQLTNFQIGEALAVVSGKTEKDVYEKLGDYFLAKAQIVRQKNPNPDNCGVF